VVVVDDRGDRHMGIFRGGRRSNRSDPRTRTTATPLQQEGVSVTIREVTGMRRRPAIWQGAAQMGLTSLTSGAALTVLFP
jgi:hypothetical protein